VPRKAATDCQNPNFQETLRLRLQNYSPDFIARNRAHCESKDFTPRPRIDSSSDLFLYANQKLNVWEQQKSLLRQSLQPKSKQNHYTYCKDFLQAAFPIAAEQSKVSEHTLSQAQMLTKDGFDTLNKRDSWNRLSLKLAPSQREDLQIPYYDRYSKKPT
jgi:hypothetical protein